MEKVCDTWSYSLHSSVKCLSQTSPKSNLVLLCKAGCRCKGAGELQCEDHLQEWLLHSVQINQIESPITRLILEFLSDWLWFDVQFKGSQYLINCFSNQLSSRQMINVSRLSAVEQFHSLISNMAAVKIFVIRCSELVLIWHELWCESSCILCGDHIFIFPSTFLHIIHIEFHKLMQPYSLFCRHCWKSLSTIQNIVWVNTTYQINKNTQWWSSFSFSYVDNVLQWKNAFM